jgi:hypothetical protein
MRKIHSRATNGIIWLRKQGDGSELAIEVLASYEQFLDYPDPNAKVPDFTKGHWVALDRLLRRGY